MFYCVWRNCYRWWSKGIHRFVPQLPVRFLWVLAFWMLSGHIFWWIIRQTQQIPQSKASWSQFWASTSSSLSAWRCLTAPFLRKLWQDWQIFSAIVWQQEAAIGTLSLPTKPYLEQLPRSLVRSRNWVSSLGCWTSWAWPLLLQIPY